MYWIDHFTALCSLMRVTRSIFAFAQIRQRSKCLFGKNYANFYLVLNGSFMVHFGNSRRVCDLSNCPQRFVTTDNEANRYKKKIPNTYWQQGWFVEFPTPTRPPNFTPQARARKIVVAVIRAWPYCLFWTMICIWQDPSKEDAQIVHSGLFSRQFCSGQIPTYLFICCVGQVRKPRKYVQPQFFVYHYLLLKQKWFLGRYSYPRNVGWSFKKINTHMVCDFV